MRRHWRSHDMAMFNQLALSALTRNEEDAGTSSTLNVTVNVDGEDVLDRDFDFDLDDGEAYIRITSTLPTPFDSNGLTNSSIRVGIRDDDAWAPQHILLFGPAQPDFQPGRTSPWLWKPICHIGSVSTPPRGTSRCRFDLLAQVIPPLKSEECCCSLTRLGPPWGRPGPVVTPGRTATSS